MNLRFVKQYFIFACCSASSLTPCQPGLCQDTERDRGAATEEIVAAIQQREAQVRNFRCSLSETTSYAPDWIERRSEWHGKPQQPAVAGGLVCQRQWSFHFDGTRYRTHRDGALPSMIDGGATNDVRSTLFDGTTQTILQEPSENRKHFNAILSDTPEDYEQLSLKPIWWFVRFFHESGLSCPTKQFSVRPGTIKVFGHEAVVIDCAKGGGLFELDPSRHYLVSRYRNRSSGDPTVVVEVDYDQHASGEWRPASWLIKCMSNGNIDTETEVVMRQWETNVTFKEEDFTLPIPKGTLIHDSRSKRNDYAAIDVSGKERDLTKQELASGELPAIIQGKSPGRFGTGKRSIVPAIVWVNVIVVVCVLAVLLRNSRRLKQSHPKKKEDLQ